MENKTKLVFSPKGDSVHVEFADGKESIIYDDGMELLKDLKALVRLQRITEEEFQSFGEEILAAKNLASKSSSSAGSPSREFLDFLIMKAMLELLFDHDDEDGPETPPKEAFLKMCSSCGLHATIYATKAKGIFLRSKADALECVERMTEEKFLNEKEIEKLKKEIDECPLPKEGSSKS